MGYQGKNVLSRGNSLCAKASWPAGGSVVCPGTKRRNEAGLQRASGRFELHPKSNGMGLAVSIWRDLALFFFTATQCSGAIIYLIGVLLVLLV